jgi:hypothetical protein
MWLETDQTNLTIRICLSREDYVIKRMEEWLCLLRLSPQLYLSSYFFFFI